MFFKVFHLKTVSALHCEAREFKNSNFQPAGDFEFNDFKYADEFGLITEYLFEKTQFRYFYSLFSEVRHQLSNFWSGGNSKIQIFQVSGLKTYCIHNRMINGNVMIMAKKRTEQKPRFGGFWREIWIFKWFCGEIWKFATKNLKKFESFVNSDFSAELVQQMVGHTPKDNYELPTMLRVLFYCTFVYLVIFLGTQMIPVRKVRLSRELVSGNMMARQPSSRRGGAHTTSMWPASGIACCRGRVA